METGIHELTAGYALDALDPDDFVIGRNRAEGPEGLGQEP